MKMKKTFRIVGLAIILSMLMIALPASPAAAATLVITPTSGPPGTIVTVTGTGYQATHAIAIAFAGTDVAEPIVVGTTISTTFTVPAGKAPGTYVVSSIDYDLQLEQAVTAFIVTSGSGSSGGSGDQDIDLNPDNGKVGAKIRITGEDFSDSEDIKIYFDGDRLDIESGGDEETDDDGEFTTYILIPEGAAGEHTIKVKDDEDVEATDDFTIEPSISLSPESGPPRKTVKVTGTGFMADSHISITFGGSTDEAGFGYTDSFGSFQADFTPLAITPGTYAIAAEDEEENKESKNYTIALETKAEMTPSEGAVGTEIQVSGVAFKQESEISIKYDDTEKKTKSDSNGAFSATIIVPASKAGDHTVTATDGETTKEFIFTMESDPPTDPKVYSPPNNYNLTIDAPQFVWQGSEDASTPIAYTLRISADSNFSEASIVLEIEIKDKLEYFLSNADFMALESPTVPVQSSRQDPNNLIYYWTVKATDATGTESKWASSRSFTITKPEPEPSPTTPPPDEVKDKPSEKEKEGGLLGNTPSWAIWVIGAMIAVLFAILGFWVGRRTAYY